MATNNPPASGQDGDPSSLPFTREQIDQANMAEAVNLCQRHGLAFDNAISVDDVKRVLYEYLDGTGEETNNSAVDEKTDESIQRMIMNITGKDIEMKNFLGEIYDSINQLIDMTQFEQSLNIEFTAKYEDYRHVIKTNQKELRKKDCPIVVTGETSAGKSSLLNLFIGVEILPSSLLRCTSVICRLRNSGKKMVVVYDENEKQADTIIINNVEELKQTIKKYTCFSDDVSNNQYKYVDIHWPIPMLHEHVIIVDTPGIGDTEEMTTTVLEYIQEAIAFIYVVNSANAGGVQDDRILRITKQQHKWKRKGKLQMINPRLAVFVCNKWDQVPKDEDEIVWNNTKHKLSQSWVDLRDVQVIKLSVNEEKRRQDNGLSYSGNFRSLLNFIKTMVPACLEGKVKRHAIWMMDFLHLVQHSTATKINASRKTKEEKNKYYQRLESRLDVLTTQTKEIKETLIKYLNSRRDKVVEDLQKHLTNEECRKRLSTWTYNECPSPETVGSSLKGAFAEDLLEDTKVTALDKINSRLKEEMSKWLLSNEDISNLPEDFSKEFREKCHMLQEESLSIHEEMRGLSVSDRNLFHIQTGGIHENRPKRLEKPNEMIALGTGLGLGLMSAMFCVVFPPILIGSCFIGLFVLLGFHNRYQRQVLHCREDYKEKRQEYMKEWTLRFLDSLKETSLRDCLDEWYFQDARCQVKSLCDDILPKIINTDRKIMKHVISDQRRAESIFTLCQPLQRKAEECQGKVLLFELLYLSDRFIQQARIRKGELIGQGACANVYKSEIFLDGKWIPVALKRFKYPMDNDTSYIQLLEIENLFKFDHPNVLKIYGASLFDVGEVKLVEIITELCEMTLADRVDTTSCGLLTHGTEEFAKAFQLFIDINIQIAEGLEHIHSKRCVHRDLKLQNILILDDRVKIADAGYLKQKELVTGSVVGSPTYIAPEVLSNRYTPSATARDIYSFGIIMWEMWYQRRAFSESQYPNIESLKDMKNLLEQGDRPCLQDDLNTFPSLKQLMESCWHDDPLKRPEITHVKETLKKIQDQYSSANRVV